jgi:putative transcriptional regulator
MADPGAAPDRAASGTPAGAGPDAASGAGRPVGRRGFLAGIRDKVVEAVRTVAHSAQRAIEHPAGPGSPGGPGRPGDAGRPAGPGAPASPAGAPGIPAESAGGETPVAGMQDHGRMTEVSLTGRLLVATPALTDPNFDRCVLLVLDHDEEGAHGVVLNRPTPVDVHDVLAGWEKAVTGPAVVFQGGPVAMDSALAIASVPGGGEPIGWRQVFGRLGLVDLDAPPEVVGAEFGSMRIFAGYAGWGPGQLEAELGEGAWYVVESEPGDAFSAEPERLWRAVLRRQRGELAMVATYPEDPSLN